MLLYAVLRLYLFLEAVVQYLLLALTMDDEIWFVIDNDSNEHLHDDEDVLD